MISPFDAQRSMFNVRLFYESVILDTPPPIHYLCTISPLIPTGR